MYYVSDGLYCLSNQGIWQRAHSSVRRSRMMMTLSLRGHSSAAMLQLVPGPVPEHLCTHVGGLKRDFPEIKEFIYLERNIKSIEEESRVRSKDELKLSLKD